jgi:molybdate transport system substrate-binding protein
MARDRGNRGEPLGASWIVGRLLAASIACAIMTSAASARAQELLLSVAVSLKDVTEELGRAFELTHPGVTLRYNFGASGELQKQIEAGAPVDLFVSAGQKQIDELSKRGLLRAEGQRVFARNVLVLVVPADSRLDLRGPADLLRPQVRRVAIGNPKTVPAGQYAQESLRTLGLWEALRPKLIFAENVRQALEYVTRAEVDAGFVYSTDAATRAGTVKEAGRPPLESYAPVTYPGAIVATSRYPALAQAFMDSLLSPAGQQVFTRRGFLPPPGTSR